MKNVFTKLTVGALMISLSITASAAGTAKDKSRDVRSKDSVTIAVERASAALKAAGVDQGRIESDKMKKLLGYLVESNRLDQGLLNASARKLTLAAMADVTTGLGAGGRQEQLAEFTLKVAAKLTNDPVDMAVIEALAQASNKTGDIFANSKDAQLDQALILADKLMNSNSTKAAIADYLSGKKGTGVRVEENSKEVEDFIETLKGCVGKRA